MYFSFASVGKVPDWADEEHWQSHWHTEEHGSAGAIALP